MMNKKIKELSNNIKMPAIGFGTYRSGNEDETAEIVSYALKVGYRQIDTASFYGNEIGIGKGIKNSGIDREEIFIVTKIWNYDHGYENTIKACNESLKKLQVEYLDLYLIHWPNELNAETWRALEYLYKCGKVKAIGVCNFKIGHLEELKKNIDESVKVIYFETPANPDLSIIDIRGLVDIAKEYETKVVVDNTFASPYFQNPLLLGADVVVHSATKYICGHGDVVGGVAISKDLDYIHYLKFDYMCEFGGVMSPFNAWLLIRGLKTLGIRMKQHEANALKLAEFLNDHPKIESVMYPGLKDFKNHHIAKEQMKGFGATLSFEVKGGIDEAIRFVEKLKLAQIAVSLGDCETLVQIPAAITHRGYPSEKLKEFGLTESMVRISVGLEDWEDIIEDVRQALED